MAATNTYSQEISIPSNSNEQFVEQKPGHNIEEAAILPPIDGGKDAWLFLAAAFTIEVLTIGKLIHKTS
jgi:hypothetical protein